VPTTATAASWSLVLQLASDTPWSPSSLITLLVSQGHGSFAGLSITKRSIGDKETWASCDIVLDNCSALEDEQSDLFVMPRSLIGPELGPSEIERPSLGMVSVMRLPRGRASCWVDVRFESSQECIFSYNGFETLPVLKTCHLLSIQARSSAPMRRCCAVAFSCSRVR
jgi:hypothetical protein